MFHHQVTRYDAGIVVDGEQINLQLIPNAKGRINVDVIVAPSLSGFDRACRLTSSDRTQDFRPGEIAITDNAVTCLAADDILPAFKEGFTCPLEPGMAPLLRTWLPRLEQVARLAGAICVAGHAQLIGMAPPVYVSHTYGAFPCVVAAIVFDGLSAADAIEMLRHNRLYGSEPAIFAVLASDPARALLVEAQQLAGTTTTAIEQRAEPQTG